MIGCRDNAVHNGVNLGRGPADAPDMPGLSSAHEPRAAVLNDLFAALWRERSALEEVLFKLIEQQALIRRGETRWLGRADDELRSAVHALRTVEVLRAAVTDEAAAELGLSAEARLQDLAEAAPLQFGLLLREHREELRTLVMEIQTIADDNSALLGAGLAAVRETLDRLQPSQAGYDATGARTGLGRSPLILDASA
jgi:hypothetical protein